MCFAYCGLYGEGWIGLDKVKTIGEGWIGLDKVKTIFVPIFEQSLPKAWELIEMLPMPKALELLEMLRCSYKGGHVPLDCWEMLEDDSLERWEMLAGFNRNVGLSYKWGHGPRDCWEMLEGDSLERWEMLVGFNINDGLSVNHLLRTPLVNELTENKWQHYRGINLASKDGSLQATQKFIHMMNVTAEGTSDQPMYDVVIIDSGAPLHCTGHRNLLTEYTPKEQPDESFKGVSGKVMPILGVGNICNRRLKMKDVNFMPSLNQQNINKTIISVVELGKLDYYVHFDGASCSIIDKRNRTWSWKTWTWTHEIVGKAHLEHKQYMVDYLRIPADRVPVTNPEGPTLAASYWKTASSGWAWVTGFLTQTQAVCSERPPV